MILRKTFLGLSAIIFLSATASAQINVDQLSAASAYDAGVLQNGSLDSALWQGVSAKRATDLIENIDTDAMGMARDLIYAALLSGGVPPQANGRLERETYIDARLSAILSLGDLAAFDKLVGQYEIARTSSVFTKTIAERALLGGDTNSACGITDEVTLERKSPYWAKMRAFCHVVRDEIPAAELTADLLSRSGHKDKIFFALLGKLTGTRPDVKIDRVDTPLQTAMLREVLETEQIQVKTLPVTFSAAIALDSQKPPDDRLKALLASASILSAEQIRSVLGGLAEAPLQSAEQLQGKNWGADIWGGVFKALSASTDMHNSAALAGAILAQADKQNQLAKFARTLAAETGIIPPELQAKHSPKIFARVAVLRNDTNALRGLFQALEADNSLRGRIALASDALGNGFLLGELGVDIETRLALTNKQDKKTQARAVRDTYIAVAMGANLSESAETILRKSKLNGRTIHPGALLALRAAARRGSKAEIALRTAAIIEGKPLRADAFADVLTVLTSAGMYEQAGKLAALDFLNDD